jgi:AHBA synthesis associated protein
MLRSIVFDLDGTLLDSERVMRAALEQSYRQVVGPGRVPFEEFAGHLGEPIHTILARLKLPRSMADIFRKITIEKMDDLVFHAGSGEILAWARANGVRTSILTGKERRRTLMILEHFGVLDRFDAVVCSDQLRFPKPHPEGLQHLMALFAVTPKATVYVGDSPSDVECARRAGVRSIGVTWGIMPDRFLGRCTPDHVVKTWAELLDLLRSLREDAARLPAGATG